TGAIGALKGPSHGGAPSLVMDQLEEIGGPDNAERWGREALEKKVRFMGFGHRVYRTYDPRAKILKAMCERQNPTFYALASKWEEVALKLLQERHPERPQATNVEFYSAGVMQSVGLPKDFFPPTFAISRAAGWTAHVLEQVANNRLIRPQSEYVGPEPKKPIPLGER
ncbi:MAG: citrate synthase/methylcitrate synthase, partial [Candidatus Dormibacteraeota bacterium]|nr:citrate synthase/methylcitrate synthase [Candidatus Dormibacteraeota bacterium]